MSDDEGQGGDSRAAASRLAGTEPYAGIVARVESGQPTLRMSYAALVAAVLYRSNRPLTVIEMGTKILGKQDDKVCRNFIYPAIKRLALRDVVRKVPGTSAYALTEAFRGDIAEASALSAGEADDAEDGVIDALQSLGAEPVAHAPPAMAPMDATPEGGEGPAPTGAHGVAGVVDASVHADGVDGAERTEDPAMAAGEGTGPAPGPAGDTGNGNMTDMAATAEADGLVDVPATRPVPQASVGTGLQPSEADEVHAVVASVTASLQALRDRRAGESRARVRAEVVRRLESEIRAMLAEGIPLADIREAVADGGFDLPEDFAPAA